MKKTSKLEVLIGAQIVGTSAVVDLWVRRTMYPSTYRCENDHWRKISPSKNCSVLKKIAVFRENLFCDTLYFSDFFRSFSSAGASVGKRTAKKISTHYTPNEV